MENKRLEALKQILMDRLEDAEAIGAGGVDELSFGLARKLAPEKFAELEKNNPGMYMGGRVGSFFIPGLGLVKGIGTAAKVGKVASKAGLLKKLMALKEAEGVAGLGKAAVKAIATPQAILNKAGDLAGEATAKVAKSGVGKLFGEKAAESGASKILQSAARQGTAAAGQAAGQSAARNALGTADDTFEESSDATTGAAEFGAGMGVISPVLSKAARAAYSHPSIFNPKAPLEKSRAMIERLLSEGHIGGEETFKKVADEAKNRYTQKLGPYMDKLRAVEEKTGQSVSGPQEVFKGLMDRMREKKVAGLKPDLKQMRNTLEGGMEKVGANPKVDDVLSLEKTYNSELRNLSDKKRMSLFGVNLQGGGNTAEEEAIGAAKGSIDNWKKKALGDNFGPEAVEDFSKAKQEYGHGRELERALNRNPGISELVRTFALPLASGAAVGYATNKAMEGDLSPAAAAMIGTGVGLAGRSLPARTGAGVALDRLSRGTMPGKITGRIFEAKDRNDIRRSRNSADANYGEFTKDTEEEKPKEKTDRYSEFLK